MKTSEQDQILVRAAEFHRAGDLAEAETLYRGVLARQPNHPGALKLLGMLALKAGRPAVAMKLLRAALAVRPDDFEATRELGMALQSLGELREAISVCRQAARLRPDNAEAQNGLGSALFQACCYEEAVSAYRAAVRIEPESAPFHSNLGLALHAAGRRDEAIAAYNEAIGLNPACAEAHHNLGNALCASGRYAEADSAFEQALQLAPNNVAALVNMGTSRYLRGDFDAAAAAFREAIRIEPSLSTAHNNLGKCLLEQGRVEAALGSLRRAAALEPASPAFSSNVIFARSYDPDATAEEILEECRKWVRRHACGLAGKAALHCNEPAPERRLRIGYVSPDFRSHAVGWNLLPLLRERDGKGFEIFAYSAVAQGDAVTAEIRNQVDGWRILAGISDERAAEMIRADGIDILVDLALHTAGNRLPVFAYKPAPVQATYLGYCGTTGLETIDYRLSDPWMDPEGMDLGVYSEETLRLPRSYWCYQPGGQAPEPGRLPADETGYVTFGCLNNFAKVAPRALELWGRILCAVSGSRLFLYSPESSFRQRVLEVLKGQGVEEGRIEFVGRQEWAQYMQSVGRLDIGLDPFPYGGGITTCDALWMGVPVVSLKGRRATGRGGWSILSNIGLPELAAESEEAYVEIAVQLAHARKRLRELRGDLRERMESSPLRDAKGCARDLENAFRQMWRSWCLERRTLCNRSPSG